MNRTLQQIELALAEPFPVASVGWKPQVVSGNRAMVISYIDARDVMDRLDAVVGVMGWQDIYEVLPDGAVICHLKVRIGEEWIEKVDVGGQSEQPDEGDRRKAAFSDALKRAAVKFGIGRYLYRLEQQWVDYDPKTRKLLQQPRLPDWATPRHRPEPAQAAAPSPSPGQAPTPAPATAPAQPATPAAPPADRSKKGKTSDLGERFAARLREREAELGKEGLCEAGELVEHVRETGAQRDYPDRLTEWTWSQIDEAAKWIDAFVEGASKALASREQGQAREPKGQRDPTSPLTQEEVDRLARLLGQKGKQFREVAKLLGLNSKLLIDNLNYSQGRRLWEMAKSWPDVKE